MSSDSHSFRRSTDIPAAKDTQPIFYPKLLTTLKEYSWKLFGRDLTAGVIVGVVALPLAIAFAIASGVSPDRGIVTAIVAGFLVSALGGSRVQIGGPTGAFVVIVYGIVEKFGVNGLIVCTMMAGVILILMGFLRLGAVIKFIPYPLTVGFTAGIAVVIFSSQMRELFGLQTGTLPADFVSKWQTYFHTAPTLDPITLGISIMSLMILFVWPKFSRRIPAPIVVIVGITAFVWFFKIPVETIGSRFGEIPTGLPRPTLPSFSYGELRQLISPAFTVALLGAIESLLSATVADGMIEGRHRSNTELIGQGVANIASSFFGGIPATGAIARTGTNVKNGGRTPVAGIIHAVTLLLIVLIFGKWAKLIPLCALASILVVVSYHMSEWRAFKNLLRAPRMDIAVLLTAFLLTLLVDLTVAVEIGMVLAMVVFMKRMTDSTTIREVTQEFRRSEEESAPNLDNRPRMRIPEGVDVYLAQGALFFGVASLIRDHLRIGKNPPKALIFRMRHVYVLDASGLKAIEELWRTCRASKTQLILEVGSNQPKAVLEHSGFYSELGVKNVVASFDAAISRAKEIVGG